jgi:hypothetical protein
VLDADQCEGGTGPRPAKDVDPDGDFAAVQVRRHGEPDNLVAAGLDALAADHDGGVGCH